MKRCVIVEGEVFWKPQNYGLLANRSPHVHGAASGPFSLTADTSPCEQARPLAGMVLEAAEADIEIRPTVVFSVAGPDKNRQHFSILAEKGPITRWICPEGVTQSLDSKED